MHSPIQRFLGIYEVPLTDAQPIGGGFGGYRTIKVGTKEAAIDVRIDLEKLANRYATKALKSKTGRLSVAHGAIVFKVDKKSVQERRFTKTPNETGNA